MLNTATKRKATTKHFNQNNKNTLAKCINKLNNKIQISFKDLSEARKLWRTFVYGPSTPEKNEKYFIGGLTPPPEPLTDILAKR